MISWKSSIYFSDYPHEVPERDELAGENPVILRNELFSRNLAGENPSNRFGADLTQM
ncbi:hypothetical protein [Paenibacillus sp. LjRoot56]|uniref:hypothetical protein n=1 Tax=Paenibacillus sp. LjRoot56 TaxID=3342333 RepID=UPI003F500173